MFGTIVNAVAIIIGGGLGYLASGLLPEKIRGAILLTLGIVVAMIGVDMTLGWINELQVIIALVFGAVIGEKLDIEAWLDRLGAKFQAMAGRRIKGDLATGFVFTSLIYCVGPMAILGAMDSGLQGNHSILLAKASIDGLTAIAFASTLGLGVLFSSVSVFIYQGLMTLGFQFVGDAIANANEVLVEQLIAQLTATGGILIIGIGIKILDLKPIRVANLLPALPMIVVIGLLAWII